MSNWSLFCHNFNIVPESPDPPTELACLEWIFSDGTTLPWESTQLAVVTLPYGWNLPKAGVVQDKNGHFFIAGKDSFSYVKSIDGGANWSTVNIPLGFGMNSTFRIVGLQLVNGNAYAYYRIPSASAGSTRSGVRDLTNDVIVADTEFANNIVADTGYGRRVGYNGQMLLGSGKQIGFRDSSLADLSNDADYVFADGAIIGTAYNTPFTGAEFGNVVVHKVSTLGYFAAYKEATNKIPNRVWEYNVPAGRWGEAYEFDGDPGTSLWDATGNVTWDFDAGSGRGYMGYAMTGVDNMFVTPLGILTISWSGQTGRVYNGVFTELYLDYSADITANSVPGFNNWNLSKDSEGNFWLIVKNFNNRFTVSRSPNGLPGTFSGRFTVNAPANLQTAVQLHIELRDDKVVFFAAIGSNTTVFEIDSSLLCVSRGPVETYGDPVEFLPVIPGVLSSLTEVGKTLTSIEVSVVTSQTNGALFFILGYNDPANQTPIVSSPITVTGAGTYTYEFTGLESGATVVPAVRAIDLAFDEIGQVALMPIVLSAE